MSDAPALAQGAKAVAAPAQQQQQQQQQPQRLCKPSELSFQTVVDLMSALRVLANHETAQPARGGGRKKPVNKQDVKKNYFKRVRAGGGRHLTAAKEAHIPFASTD